jgi:hypothetical protein
MKISILDDYHDTLRTLACFRKLVPDFDVVFLLAAVVLAAATVASAGIGKIEATTDLADANIRRPHVEAVELRPDTSEFHRAPRS